MNKDIIYIDTEDDITSIIGKIKSSKDKIIALVPPKRTGVLQSAVNLRLLARTAQNQKKHLVLITNNKALISLSSIAKIPVAKNLQSKPEIAEIAAIKIDDDVIDGSRLPIGELARTVRPAGAKSPEIVKTHDFSVEESDEETDELIDQKPKLHKKESVEDVIDDIDIDDEDEVLIQPSSIETKESDPVKPQKSVDKKNANKIPDFSRFRKKLFFGSIALVSLIVFGIWATIYAPAATVTITAKTSKAPVSVSVKLVGSEATNIEKRTAQVVTKTIKKDLSVDFTATGNEDRGEKATGTATLCNASKGWEIEVVAGSIFSSGEYDFVTTKSVDVPAATVNDGIVAGCIDVAIVASEIGSEYNLAAGNYDSSVANVTAKVTATTGGSSHKATIVTAEDIEKATQALKELPTSSFKNQLTAQFTSGESVIAESFNVDYGTLVANPILGAELLAGKAKLTASATFTMSGIAKADIVAYLKDSLNKQVTGGQRIYDDGSSSVKLTGYSKNDTSTVVSIEATGKIGPDIDKEKVKLQVKGEQYGDVQSTLSSIDGVSNVDTTFSYFWVRTVPDDIKKITVEFKIEND